MLTLFRLDWGFYSRAEVPRRIATRPTASRWEPRTGTNQNCWSKGLAKAAVGRGLEERNQMLSLRSLAFILASAIRRARALFCAACQRFPDSISGRKMATKIATEMLTKMAVDSMSVP